MSTIIALMQAGTVTTPVVSDPLLSLAQVFTLLFVVMGPPLKTPIAYEIKMHGFDAHARRKMAWRTFAMAAIALLAGGFVGLALQRSWRVSVPAMVLAGGLIFLLVSLRTVLDQYTSGTSTHVPIEPGRQQVPAMPTAFELAVPMIVTPYGMAGLITLLASSHGLERTLGIVGMLMLVLVLHLAAMLFSGPIMKHIGPLPFRIFGTVVGSLTVGLSLQMLIVGLQQWMPGIFHS